MTCKSVSGWQYFLQVATLTLAIASSAAVAIFYWELGEQVSASPVWPSAGIGLAALLLGGERLWPGIFFRRFFTDAIFWALRQCCVWPRRWEAACRRSRR
ncbi:MAG: hypothetical protein HC890_11325 [Chloroflexaceae bacterium]|nr:hypothetical protein [Chloroflexaceae bacterium]